MKLRAKKSPATVYKFFVLAQNHAHIFLRCIFMLDLSKPKLHATFRLGGFTSYRNNELNFWGDAPRATPTFTIIVSLRWAFEKHTRPLNLNSVWFCDGPWLTQVVPNLKSLSLAIEKYYRKPQNCRNSLSPGPAHFFLLDVILRWALPNPSCKRNLKLLASAVTKILKGKPQILRSSLAQGLALCFFLVKFYDGPRQTLPACPFWSRYLQ